MGISLVVFIVGQAILLPALAPIYFMLLLFTFSKIKEIKFFLYNSSRSLNVLPPPVKILSETTITASPT